ncbi:dTDP-4-dehydrorhamnose 3,5-epimerase [Arcticibacter tournemirensis]|uniref:dTDP-4-dehydrorhamnose 3,5-epimerase n=1 Tax=Arcticibacter tournemirensis TaxID=699437 RepID=A0A5M9H523_9SPHI|nr:dTDP-4-dehydrorhamnose 3,5-epimerase [Arcticibacter tournemirensis]KAA8482033.1 dTDP-4-dehydrorhamnose 3,5-epimerase [Arcticibacter tournemirensis]TQM49438.1 dTDP-4-dehydrorhamnose 3,5-epimerase [Arcticibacter tournemirensis]
MEIIKTPIDGCFVIKPAVFPDPRGYFFESFNEQRFNEKSKLNIHFVQDNQSMSSYGVLRGLHFQKGEHAQAKLVRVLKGEVLDVAVDLRQGSATYGQYYSVLLSEENKLQFFVPRGFAHGFVVLSKHAEFFYKCDNYYNKGSEGGLHYADPSLNIDWKIPFEELLVSDKDKELPVLEGL